MYNPKYVKKKKRRKVAFVVGTISSVVVAVFSIVAFLGRFVGTFTISLDTGKVNLALCRKSDFANPTSFLRVDSLPLFYETTYSYIKTVGDEQIDNESTDIKVGVTAYNTDGSIKALNFFKYTFYVKNIGDIPARYTFALNILDSSPDTNGKYLDHTLRVMLYENEGDTHNSKVFAKRSPVATHYTEDGEPLFDAPISDAEGGDDFQGYATSFKNNSLVTSFNVPLLQIGEMRRYTVVSWLEGYASDDNTTAPKGAKMKLGVEINAYEI